MQIKIAVQMDENRERKSTKVSPVVRRNTLQLPDLAAFEGKRVEVIVVEEEAESQPRTAQPVPRRRFGTLAGQFVVPDDFDAPLPFAGRTRGPGTG